MRQPDFGNGHARARSGRRSTRLAMLLATSALAAPALAETVATAPPPVAQSVDKNGVDILSGQYAGFNPSISIGDATNGAGESRGISGGTYTDSLTAYLQDTGNIATVTVNGAAVKFNETAGVFTPVVKNGDTLVKDASGYTYTTSDGTAYRFSGTSYIGAHFGTIFGVPLQTVTHPSGKTETYYYLAGSFPSTGDVGLRLQAVVTNTGYELHFNYARDDVPTQSSEAAWSDAIDVVALNSLHDTCSTTSYCVNPGGYPEVSNSTTTATQKLYQDSAGNQTHLQIDAQGHLIGIAPPASINNAYMSYSGYFNGQFAVNTITTDRGTTNYAYSTSGTIGTVTETNGSATRTYRVDLTNSHVLAVIDELNRETDYHYNSSQLLDQVTYPKGNFDTFVYDARGNLTTTVRHPKAGSALPSITTSATYPADACANPVTCNKPTSTTDGNGKTTDYTYDPVHGGVATVTGPAPTAGAVRPQTRYHYARLDVHGAPSSSGVYVLADTSSCATLASCAGTADETVTTYTYGDNYLLKSVTIAAGDGSVSSTKSMTYDKVGNMITVDGPLAGAADVTTFKYNLNRQLTATVSPDPDGTGTGNSLKPRVRRTTYSPRGLPTKVEVGTADGPSDAQVAAMTVLQTVDTSYDYYGRKVSDKLSAGSTAYSLTQYAYDAVSNLSCVATRMDPTSNFASAPTDACTATSPAGSFGPDRITQNGYDAADQLRTVTDGVGTSTPRTTSYTYNLNGNLQTVTDAKGNVTNYVYDDLVRLSELHYPDPDTGAWSPTDYEAYGYDGAGNMTTRRVRNNTTITYGYDALNRLTSKTPSSGATNATATFAYDLLGRMTNATASTTAHTVIDKFGYDALGRKTSDESLLDGYSAGKKTMQYDAGGRRTSLAWPDLTLTFDYDNVDEMKHIFEGATPLETFSYDDLGRRASRSAANGTSAGYSYDPVSRLTTLSISGGGSPTSVTLGNYSPANQIGYRTIGDAYATNVPSNGTHSFAINGRNQVAQIDGAIQTYDPKGNKLTLGSTSFTYGIENLLMTGGSSTFIYDALNRLVNSSTGKRFDYDDDQLVSETNVTGAIARRYLFGPATDEPLVWYEGAGSSTKRFMDADERGSVIRVTDASGAAVAANAYDEYGQPNATNIGRFQFTGQAWMPEVGLYYYKARMYSPSLGRFMQPDPVGQSAGPNIYNYVGSDPINRSDPTGLDPNDLDFGDVTVTGDRWKVDLGLQLAQLGWALQRASSIDWEKEGRLILAAQKRSQKISPCMQAFLASQGYAANNLGAVTFQEGDGGRAIAAMAFRNGNPAITLGNNIYVKPGHWSEFSPGSRGYFEETLHTIQWNLSGRANFILSWALGTAMGKLATGDPHNSPLEAQAMGLSIDLENAYNDPSNKNKCP